MVDVQYFVCFSFTAQGFDIAYNMNIIHIILNIILNIIYWIILYWILLYYTEYLQYSYCKSSNHLSPYKSITIL